MNIYQQFIHKSRYARWNDSLHRREHWHETVDRYIDFISEHCSENYSSLSKTDIKDLRNSILNLEIMPSMRALMTAGKALKLDPTAAFNCSFLPINSPRCFDELMYILMCGTGVGFSVESKFVNALPIIAEDFYESATVVVVGDSKIGWASAFRELISLLYAGKIPKIDVSKVRPKGARLKTFGGRSSGPEPLLDLFTFSINLFKRAAGRKLSTIEAHDLVCKIADIVVVGGVRRCLPENSLVHTKQGMTPIQNVNIGDLVLTSKGYHQVTNKFYQGKQFLVKVTTQDSSFECTPNHKIAVLNGYDSYLWKMAKDLQPLDRIIAPSIAIEGMETSLPKFQYDNPKHSTTCKDIEIPKLDHDLAWLLGLIQGDGYVSLSSGKGEITIPVINTQKEIGDKAKIQLERFGVNVGITQNENYYVLRVASKQLATYFHSWLKQSKTPLNVPEFIWKSTKEIKLSFVAGLMDADGSVSTRPVQVCTTVYQDYAKQIRLLLSSCGIQTRLKTLSTTNLKENWQKKYAVAIINNKAKAAVNSYTNKQISYTATEQYTNSYPKELLDFPYANNYSWSKTDNKLIPVSVVNVESISEEKETWDLEVENVHEFFCEGYLMHNSALISLSDLNDDKLRDAKSGQWWETNVQRALANNSAVYEEKPDISKFLDEWHALYKSQSGERGIFNRKAAISHSDNGRRDLQSIEHAGLNPCQPAFAPILTRDGLRTFADINIGDRIWSAEGWTKVVNKWSTGIKPVYAYKTSAGVFYGTENHRVLSYGEKVEVGVAESIDALRGCTASELDFGYSEIRQSIMDGLLIGDGSVHLASHDKIYLNVGAKDQDYFNSEIKDLIIGEHAVKKGSAYKVQTTLSTADLPHTYLRQIPEKYLHSNSNLVCAFLRGLYSANGSICGNRITLKTTSKTLIEQVQLMLSSIGIKSYITSNKGKEVEFSNGTYQCKNSYDLNISEDRNIFYNTIGFIQKYKQEKLQELLKINGKTYKNSYEITSIEYLGDMEVFDITVDNPSHTYWTGGLNVSNCAEIILRPMEFCNLSEVVIRPEDTLESLKRKVRLATILGTVQSTFTDFRYLRKIWKDNCEEERLLGVSLTGIMDNTLTSGKEGLDKLENLLTELKQVSIEVNAEYAKKFGINQSVAITCVKPSGTVSQLVGSSSGIHPSYSPYYIRTVRSDIKDPLATFMQSIGIHCEPDVTKPNDNLVFSFPIKSPESSINRDELTAIDQLNLYKVYRDKWCEHNPSITVYVKENEWIEVAAWVYKNFDSVCGISFLPFSDHIYKQAPYQPCSKEEYEELLSKYPTEINWDDLAKFEVEDGTIATQELSCSAGVCDII